MDASSSPLEFIRRNRAMYLGSDEPSGKVLAVRLADCALISGARRLELLVLTDGWTAVAADADWITPNLREQRDASMERAFKAMTPLRGGQPNEIRFEVIVTAFSRSVSVRSEDRWHTIVGDAPPRAVQDSVRRNEFAVVFQADGKS